MNNDINDVMKKLIEVSGDERSNTPLPDDALIAQYEKATGFTFSSDYKKVLKEVSNIFYGSLDLLSVTKDKNQYGELLTVLNEARKQGLPHDLLPICEDNSNYYCLDCEGSVRYWSHDGYDNEKWPNLATWIKEVWIDGN